MSFTGASPEELPRVVRAYDLHILVGRPCGHSVFYLLSLGGEKTWGLVVEGKADRVKDGAFACSGLSADEEEGLVCKWGRREVQECIFDGCYIVYFKYFQFHVPVLYSICNVLISAVVRQFPGHLLQHFFEVPVHFTGELFPVVHPRYVKR